MAYVHIGYNDYFAWPGRLGVGINADDTTSPNVTIDAQDEEVHFIGNLELPAGTTSVTFDTNTSIQWQAGATTFANAGTTLRIGVQDVDDTTGAPGRGDGTFDCYADLVGGTDTITSNSWQTTTMETGSKTVNNGALIALCWKLVSRGGTDSVALVGLGSGGFAAARPVVVSNIGAGFAARNYSLSCAINFNGTYAIFTGAATYNSRLTSTFNSGSTPDERGNTFKLPFACKVAGILARNMYGAASTTFDVTLYSDPTGTPAALTGGAVTVDTDTLYSASAGDAIILFAAPVELKANTLYAVTIKPSSTTNVGIATLAYANATVANLHMGNDSVTYCARSDGSGAFTETTTSKAVIQLLISHIDTGAAPTYLAGVM